MMMRNCTETLACSASIGVHMRTYRYTLARSRTQRSFLLSVSRRTCCFQIQRVSGSPREGFYRVFGDYLDCAGVPRNERRLFHGTTADAIDGILKQGFLIVMSKCEGLCPRA